jgi:hypothetical protein
LLVGVAHDAAVTGGVLDGRGQERQPGAGCAKPAYELGNGRVFNEGVIAEKDNEAVDVRQRCESTLHRVARTAWRILDHGDDIARAFKPLGEISHGRPDDEDELMRPRAFPGAQRAGDHGNPGNGVQRFGNRRAHPRAGAGGKHHERNPFVSSR